MIYELLTEKYKNGEPIFFSDIYNGEISKSALTQQLSALCKKGLLAKYDNGIYYLPKETRLTVPFRPSADTVARYKYIYRNGKTDGYYSGNTFANQLGISTQVPYVIEIVSNNTNSAPREVLIGKRKFHIRKPVVPITNENVYILQLLDLLSNLDSYSEYDYEYVREYFLKYIDNHKITRGDIDLYIRCFPLTVFKFYYELKLDNVLHN